MCFMYLCRNPCARHRALYSTLRSPLKPVCHCGSRVISPEASSAMLPVSALLLLHTAGLHFLCTHLCTVGGISNVQQSLLTLLLRLTVTIKLGIYYSLYNYTWYIPEVGMYRMTFFWGEISYHRLIRQIMGEPLPKPWKARYR